jgi:hypothetical protein
VRPRCRVTMRRALGAYISERDMQQLFVKSIECDVDGIRDRFGVPFQIFYGVSGNDHGFCEWRLAGIALCPTPSLRALCLLDPGSYQ